VRPAAPSTTIPPDLKRLPPELRRRSLYKAALRDLAKTFTLEGCLAYGELIFGHRPWPHHRELVTAELSALASGEDTLILEPAGAAKTTWGNTTFLSWLIAHRPDIRVGLFSQTTTFAEGFSRAIMNIYEQNEEHRFLFGDLVNGGKWTNGEWIRKDSKVAQTKDLTVFAGGTGGQVASKRFDVLLLDDILGEENTSTVDQREKAKEWFDKTLYPRLVAQGVCIAFGTRWAAEDLYETLMNPIIPTDAHVEPGYGFRTIVRRALITPDPDDQRTWTSYWEDQWPIEELLKRRARNRARFDATYQNDVGGLLSGDVFQRPWFQYYGTPEGDPEKEAADKARDLSTQIITKRMGVDLAFSIRDRADFTARVTSAEDTAGNFFVMRTHREKIDVGHPEFVSAGYEQMPTIGLVIIESNQAQSAVVRQLTRDYPRIPVVAHNADNDKMTRATAMAERYKQRKVWHHMSLKSGDYERELLGFPKGHDDFVDAGGYSMQLGGSSFFFGKLDIRR